MTEYFDFWKNYANFTGKTSRRGYWMWVLINYLVTILLSVISSVLPVLRLIPTIYTVAILIPSLAIAVRRLRDAGKSWGWMFINLIPLVGQIIWIVLLCKKTADTEMYA